MANLKNPAILAAAALLATCAAHAHDLEMPAVIGVHTFSAHASSGRDAPGAVGWNNVNPGLYARWSNGFTIGSFRNSMFRRSDYIAWTFGDRVALTVGIASGYDRMVSSGGDHTAMRCTNVCREVQLRSVLSPLIVPSVSLPITQRWSARLSVIKAPRAPAAAHLSFEFKL